MLNNIVLSQDLINKKSVNNFIRTFAKKDNWHNLDEKTANLGYAWIHYSFIRNIKPNNILVIGSKYGLIPAICALACKDNRFGHVTFVDAGYGQEDVSDNNHWGGVGFWKTNQGRDIFTSFKLDRYITVRIMTTQQFYENNKQQPYGYIHLDGDHSYEGVSYDFKNSWSLLSSGGICCFHDIYTKNLGSTRYGVNKLWLELKQSKQYNMFEFPGICGLGLVQK